MALSHVPSQRERQLSYYKMVREGVRRRIQEKVAMNSTIGISAPTFVHLNATESDAFDHLMPEWRDPAFRFYGCRAIAPEDCV